MRDSAGKGDREEHPLLGRNHKLVDLQEYVLVKSLYFENGSDEILTGVDQYCVRIRDRI